MTATDDSKVVVDVPELPSVFFRPFLTESIREKVLKIEVKLADYLMGLDYQGSGVTHLSNPLDHARLPHTMFLQKYLDGEKEILFLGMNPGPWGMCQTGIPFGAVQPAKHFLGIQAPVQVPDSAHPKRPIQGFECTRREVSGERFWNLFSQLCTSPDRFFNRAFVYNHCPVAFMKESGKNITPPELPKPLREQIVAACDAALIQMIELLNVGLIIGLGKFAEARAKAVVKKNKLQNIRVGFLMHPSPINPVANRGWNEIALRTLEELGVLSELRNPT